MRLVCDHQGGAAVIEDRPRARSRVEADRDGHAACGENRVHGQGRLWSPRRTDGYPISWLATLGDGPGETLNLGVERFERQAKGLALDRESRGVTINRDAKQLREGARFLHRR